MGMHPIQEGVIIKCAQYGIDIKYADKICNLVLMKNPELRKVAELMNQGKIKVGK